MLPSFPPPRLPENSRSDPPLSLGPCRSPRKCEDRFPFSSYSSMSPRHLSLPGPAPSGHGTHTQLSWISNLHFILALPLSLFFPSAFSCHGYFIQLRLKSLRIINIFLGKPAALLRHQACANSAGIPPSRSQRAF